MSIEHSQESVGWARPPRWRVRTGRVRMTVGARSWWRTLRPAAVVAAVLGGAAVAPATAGAGCGAGADCQPYAAAPCLFPFPDDRLTVPDRKAVTGLRVHLPQAAMPTKPGGPQLKVLPS